MIDNNIKALYPITVYISKCYAKIIMNKTHYFFLPIREFVCYINYSAVI